MDTYIFMIGRLGNEIGNFTTLDFLPISGFEIVLEENANLYLRDSSASQFPQVTNSPVIDRLFLLAILMNSFPTLQNPLGFRSLRLL